MVLWFAEKFVSLLIEQHLFRFPHSFGCSCDLLKNSYLCLLNNTNYPYHKWGNRLWFAEKFVSLLIEQHPNIAAVFLNHRCDLLKNSYLCLLNNTWKTQQAFTSIVVICWKIRIFAYWTTPQPRSWYLDMPLWFAEKFVSLLIEQHLNLKTMKKSIGCDLLKNSYLCLLNNTWLCGSSSIWECCKQWQKWEKSHAWRKKPR